MKARKQKRRDAAKKRFKILPFKRWLASKDSRAPLKASDYDKYVVRKLIEAQSLGLPFPRLEKETA